MVQLLKGLAIPAVTQVLKSDLQESRYKLGMEVQACNVRLWWGIDREILGDHCLDSGPPVSLEIMPQEI